MSLLSDLFGPQPPHVCGETNHDFRARFSEGAPIYPPNFDAGEIVYDESVEDVIEACKPKTYIGDICIHCGKFIQR